MWELLPFFRAKNRVWWRTSAIAADWTVKKKRTANYHSCFIHSFFYLFIRTFFVIFFTQNSLDAYFIHFFFSSARTNSFVFSIFFLHFFIHDFTLVSFFFYSIIFLTLFFLKNISSYIAFFCFLISSFLHIFPIFFLYSFFLH